MNLQTTLQPENEIMYLKGIHFRGYIFSRISRFFGESAKCFVRLFVTRENFIPRIFLNFTIRKNFIPRISSIFSYRENFIPRNLIFFNPRNPRNFTPAKIYAFLKYYVSRFPSIHNARIENVFALSESMW